MPYTRRRQHSNASSAADPELSTGRVATGPSTLRGVRMNHLPRTLGFSPALGMATDGPQSLSAPGNADGATVSAQHTSITATSSIAADNKARARARYTCAHRQRQTHTRTHGRMHNSVSSRRDAKARQATIPLHTGATHAPCPSSAPPARSLFHRHHLAARGFPAAGCPAHRLAALGALS